MADTAVQAGPLGNLGLDLWSKDRVQNDAGQGLIPGGDQNAQASAPTAPGSPNAETVLMSLMQQRMANPTDLALRDQEHAAFSRYLLDRLGPVLGPAVVMSSVPAYSAAKAVSQPLGFMPNATPPSMGEVKAGLSPVTDPLMQRLYTMLKLYGIIR